MKSRNYRESIRNILFLYALIPALLLAILLGFSVYYVLSHNTYNQNHQFHARMTDHMEEALRQAVGQAALLSRHTDFAAQLEGGKLSPQWYAELYRFVNACPFGIDFYILDASYEALPSSTIYLPAYIENPGTSTSGMWAALQQGDGVAVVWERSDLFGKHLAVGSKIYRGEVPVGYLLFDFSEREFTSLVGERDSTDVLVADALHYAYWSTNAWYADNLKKLPTEIRGADGYLVYNDKILYISTEALLDGQLYLYTISDLTNSFRMIIVTGVVLCAFLLIITLLNIWASRKIAHNKTIVIDKIVNTMETAQGGDLDTVMVINTGDEFERIAVSYNELCTRLRCLIEDNKEIAQRQMIAELRQLESQFNPHFLFNTLETIKYLISIDSQSAQKAIVSLSELLRYSIYNSLEAITLAQEVYYLECYLFIQKLRFQEKLSYTVHLDEGISDYELPRLILQPLVENAIKYGKDEDGRCHIAIKARLAGEALLLEVADCGVLLSNAHLAEIERILTQKDNTSNHIGIYTVNKRVKLAYGDTYGLTAKKNGEHGMCFTVKLPGQGGAVCLPY